MVRYELIKETKNINKLINLGIVPLSIATRMQVYETYLENIKKMKKSQAVRFTADHYQLSDSQIYKVINYMESN